MSPQPLMHTSNTVEVLVLACTGGRDGLWDRLAGAYDGLRGRPFGGAQVKELRAGE